MTDTSHRLLQLLSLLQRRPHWTGPELAERLAVTPRTVRRDVERLRRIGYPVEAAPGPEGGYHLGAGGDLPPLLLDADEALAVAVSLGTSTVRAAWGIEEASLAALTKIQRLLPATLRSRVDALRASTDLAPASGDPLSLPVLTTLAQAIDGDERVTVDYVDRRGRHSERRLEPHRLVVVNRRWYLLARDLDRDDWRTFRVDRARGVERTGHRFVPTPVTGAVELVTESVTTEPYRYRATVRFDAPAADVARRVPPSVGSVRPVDGGAVLRVGGDDLRAITAHLVALELPFEVLEPPELRAHVAELGRTLARTHRGPGGPPDG